MGGGREGGRDIDREEDCVEEHIVGIVLYTNDSLCIEMECIFCPKQLSFILHSQSAGGLRGGRFGVYITERGAKHNNSISTGLFMRNLQVMYTIQPG